MDPFKFECCMKDLGQIFTPLSSDQMDIYFEYFKNVPEHIFKEAVKIVGKYHQFKSFPVPAEIEEAVREAYSRIGSPDPAEKGCEKCNKTGFILENGVARHCSCEYGQRIKVGNLEYFVSERMKFDKDAKKRSEAVEKYLKESKKGAK